MPNSGSPPRNTLAAASNTDSRPAGTDLTGGLALSAYYQQLPYVVTADASFAVANNPGSVDYSISESITGSAFTRQAGPHDTVLTLSSAQPVPGVLTVQYSSGLSHGPSASVDVGDDGSVEWSRANTAGSQTWEQQVTVNGQLQIRTSTALSISSQSLQLRFVPLVESRGSGCISGFASFYHPPNAHLSAFSLDGKELVLDDYGGGFRVYTRPGTMQPIGSLGTPIPGPPTIYLTAAPGSLGMVIHANGKVAFAPGNSVATPPSVQTMLSTNPATALYAWSDLDPFYGGQIWYEENGQDYQVTYDDVRDLSGYRHTIQFRGNRLFNDHVISIDTDVVTGSPFLVGYSPGGPNLDPGPQDFTLRTAANPYVSREPDVQALTLNAITAPVLGAPFVVTTDDIEPGAVLHAGIIGLTDPALPLASFGLDPTCTQHASSDAVLIAPLAPGQTFLSWTPIDLTNATIQGLPFHLQAATLHPSGLSFTRLSNGLWAQTY